MHRRIWQYCALVVTLMRISCLPCAQAEENTLHTLPQVLIEAPEIGQTPRLNPDVRTVRKQLAQTPGGTNLVQLQNKYRLQTLTDALGSEPGIVMQEFFGGWDQPRLNIRGSGIQSSPMNRGILLLQDGLPLNEADGSFVISTIEPRNSSMIVVRRGANAENPAATSLGGEVDLRTAVSDAANFVSTNGGSFGRSSLSVGVGGQGEVLDGRMFFSHDQAQGYRHHSASERSSFRANVGFRTHGIENRTYLSYTDLGFAIPMVIQKSRMLENPRSVLGDYPREPNVYLRNPNRQTRQFRIANRTAWGQDEINHALGWYGQTVDDMFRNPVTAFTTTGHTVGAQWGTQGELETLTYRLGLSWARSDLERGLQKITPRGRALPAHARYALMADNKSVDLQIGWKFLSDWTLLGDVRYVQSQRNASDMLGTQRLSQTYQATLPKVGLIWQASKNLQVFANLSRSAEAPTFWEIVSGNALVPLQQQLATTVELGTRGTYQSLDHQLEWSASIYRSNVSNELLELFAGDGFSKYTLNYNGRTVHQGLELGVKGQSKLSQGRLEYMLAYSFNDFRFDGSQFAGKQIAGVPRHLINAELMYRYRDWGAGATLRWMPTRTQTNHANIAGTEQDSYAVLGLRFTYQPTRDWQFYASVDNLTNRIYASAFAIRATGSAMMPTFLAGNGRSFNVGLTYSY